jgi:hypothetical protein
MHRSELMQPQLLEDRAAVARRMRDATRRESREAFAALVGLTVLIGAAMDWRLPW